MVGNLRGLGTSRPAETFPGPVPGAHAPAARDACAGPHTLRAGSAGACAPAEQNGWSDFCTANMV